MLISDWSSDVCSSDLQILATTETDKPADIRNRAILMLLSIYGMRRGEVVALRLDQVDWAGRTLHVFRLKRRQPQVYPLLPTVAEALARYIDTVRPHSRSEEHTSELQSLMRSSYAVFCLKKKKTNTIQITQPHEHT